VLAAVKKGETKAWERKRETSLKEGSFNFLALFSQKEKKKAPGECHSFLFLQSKQTHTPALIRKQNTFKLRMP
jgi:hypothetical protein